MTRTLMVYGIAIAVAVLAITVIESMLLPLAVLSGHSLMGWPASKWVANLIGFSAAFACKDWLDRLWPKRPGPQ